MLSKETWITKLQLFAIEYSLEMKLVELKKDACLQFLKVGCHLFFFTVLCWITWMCLLFCSKEHAKKYLMCFVFMIRLQYHAQAFDEWSNSCYKIHGWETCQFYTSVNCFKLKKGNNNWNYKEGKWGVNIFQT